MPKRRKVKFVCSHLVREVGVKEPKNLPPKKFAAMSSPSPPPPPPPPDPSAGGPMRQHRPRRQRCGAMVTSTVEACCRLYTFY